MKYLALVLLVSLSACGRYYDRVESIDRNLENVSRNSDSLENLDQKVDRLSSEVNSTNQTLDEMTSYVDVMTQTFVALKEMSVSLFNALYEQLFAERDPAETPDIDDLLKHFFDKSAIASENATTLQSRVCVEQELGDVHEFLIDYENYKNLDDDMRSSFTVPGLGTRKIKLADMFKSQAKFLERSETHTDAYVLIYLQPLNIQDSSVYPKFILRCFSEIRDARFDHACSLDQEKPHFALDIFESKMIASTVTKEMLESEALPEDCQIGDQYLDYHLILEGNSEQIAEIKEEALGPLGFLAPLVDLIFNEKEFFKTYYGGFYRSWLSAL